MTWFFGAVMNLNMFTRRHNKLFFSLSLSSFLQIQSVHNHCRKEAKPHLPLFSGFSVYFRYIRILYAKEYNK